VVRQAPSCADDDDDDDDKQVVVVVGFVLKRSGLGCVGQSWLLGGLA
jgi:hypothetical protein